jgi:hypothetical protein
LRRQDVTDSSVLRRGNDGLCLLTRLAAPV